MPTGKPFGDPGAAGEKRVGGRVRKENAPVFLAKENRRRRQASENAHRSFPFALEELRPFPDPLGHRPERFDEPCEVDRLRSPDRPGWLAGADALGGGDEVLERPRELERPAPSEREGSESDAHGEEDERIHRLAPRGVLAQDYGERRPFLSREGHRCLRHPTRAGPDGGSQDRGFARTVCERGRDERGEPFRRQARRHRHGSRRGSQDAVAVEEQVDADDRCRPVQLGGRRRPLDPLLEKAATLRQELESVPLGGACGGAIERGANHHGTGREGHGTRDEEGEREPPPEGPEEPFP